MWDRCPDATPFLNPAWLLPWWDHLFGGGQLLALEIRRCGQLAGLMPLFIYGYGSRPEIRRVATAGSGVSDYLDLLIEPALAAEGAAAVLSHLAARRSEWEVCDLQELRASSPLLHSQVLDRMEALTEPCSICPVLQLPGTMAELESRLVNPFRTSFRRARNRLLRQGARFEAACAHTLEEFLDALFSLHAARWSERDDSGVLSGPRLQSFYRATAAAMLKSGFLRLYGLRMSGKLVSLLYGFAAHGRMYAYITGFDPNLAHSSPGTVLVGMAIEQAIAEGMREFDFLRKPEQFKYDWGASDRCNYRLELLAESGMIHDRLSRSA